MFPSPHPASIWPDRWQRHCTTVQVRKYQLRVLPDTVVVVEVYTVTSHASGPALAGVLTLVGADPVGFGEQRGDAIVPIGHAACGTVASCVRERGYTVD